LREEGYPVYDFRNPPGGAGFGWEQVLTGEAKRTKGPYRFSAAETRAAVDHPIAQAGYRADITGVRECGAIVLVLPAGRSASFEFGYAMGMQRARDESLGDAYRDLATALLPRLRAIVYQPEPEEPELMFREAAIVDTLDSLVAALRAK